VQNVKNQHTSQANSFRHIDNGQNRNNGVSCFCKVAGRPPEAIGASCRCCFFLEWSLPGDGDWTYSPIVALHFATSDFTKYDRDGMIWAVDYVNSVNYLPEKLATIIKSEGAHVFTAELLDQAVPNAQRISLKTYAAGGFESSPHEL
jgi:hypothetical protein